MRKSSPGGHQACNHRFSYRFDRFLKGSREAARMSKSSPGGHHAWQPEAARSSQQQPAAAKSSQGQPGAARSSQENVKKLRFLKGLG